MWHVNLPKIKQWKTKSHFRLLNLVVYIYKINMNTQLLEHSSFEQLLRTEKETIVAQLGPEILKIRVTVKGRQNSSEVYQCTVKSSDVEGKLSEYFQHLNELKQYMKNSQNVKVDLQKKMLDVIAKGPTKRASYILLCQFKLTLLQKSHKEKQTSVPEAEEWIDNLASEIISIIQTKSKAKEREESTKNFVRKNELEEAIELLRAELQTSIQKNTQQILVIKQQNRKLENKKILSHIEVKEIQQLQSNRVLLQQQFVRRQQLANIESKIKQLRNQLESKMISNQLQMTQELKQESHSLLQNMTRQINIKINEISINFSTKQEIDVIIKKVQNIGSKLESLSIQHTKALEKDALHERLHMQEKKLSQIEGKLGKQTESKDESPQKQEFTPSGTVSAEEWIDKTCSHYGRINLKENSITMTSYGNARLFGRILVKQKPIFHVRINTMSNRMALGVIDTQYKQNVIFGEEPNVITYQSDKRSWNGKKQKFEQGEGFKVDDTVTVSVDVDLGTILWKVGNTLRYSWQSDELRNNKIKWVPFIKLFDKGDKVTLLQ